MAAYSIGTFIVISFVSLVVISTSRGRTWLYAGINRTSSNVRPSPKNLSPARRSGEELLLAGIFLVAMCKDRRAGVYAQNGIFIYILRLWHLLVFNSMLPFAIHKARDLGRNELTSSTKPY